MKKISFLLIIILTFVNVFWVFSAEDETTDLTTTESNKIDDSLEKSLIKYRNMKIAGIILTSVGGASLINGLTMGIIYQTMYQTNPGNFPGTGKNF